MESCTISYRLGLESAGDLEFLLDTDWRKRYGRNTAARRSLLAPLKMDLGLDLEPSAAFKRELTLADLELSDAPPAKPAGQRLRKLRDTHHALARALAAGLKEGEAAAVTGYSIVTVSILKTDPAFQNLIAYYRNKVDETFADMQARMSSFATDIVEELRDRFQEEPEKMSSPFLKDLLTTFTDRTGNGPRTTQVNVNIDLASRLDAARRRAGLLEIEGSVIPDRTPEAAPAGEEVLAPPDLLPNPPADSGNAVSFDGIPATPLFEPVVEALVPPAPPVGRGETPLAVPEGGPAAAEAEGRMAQAEYNAEWLASRGLR